MDERLFRILGKFRSCFSHKATYYWFLVIMIGMIVRADHYGVSSIVRWLSLCPANYLPILHFYNSNAWDIQSILLCWWMYCLQEVESVTVNGRTVLLGDHTNQPKDGRKMSGVVTIHQNSETSSKPGYFRGHVWGFIALLMGNGNRYFAVPLWGELNIKEWNDKNSLSMTTRMVYNGIHIAQSMNKCMYLTLDAFFAVGPVFLMAASICSIEFMTQWVHIITRAKKNAVAYEDPISAPLGKRGRKKKYGKKITLVSLFNEKINEFLEVSACVYSNTEIVKILCIDLIWKPIKGKIRFVLAVTSRGPIVLMSSDLTLSPVQTLELYCKRSAIECMFSVLKNLMGGLCYHFWSKQIEKSSRRPKKNKKSKDSDEDVSTQIIKSKIKAMEMFVNMSAILVGIFQILALHFPKEIWNNNTRWFRTFSSKIPSEYIVKAVLTQKIFFNLSKVNNHAIYTLIRSRQSRSDDTVKLEKTD